MNCERDYLKVAQLESEEKILANHWQNIAKKRIWISQNGEKKSIMDINNHHLVTICKMLIRFNSETSEPALEMVLGEIERRLKVNKVNSPVSNEVKFYD